MKFFYLTADSERIKYSKSTIFLSAPVDEFDAESLVLKGYYFPPLQLYSLQGYSTELLEVFCNPSLGNDYKKLHRTRELKEY